METFTRFPGSLSSQPRFSYIPSATMRASTQTAASLALLVLMLSSSILASYPPISCCFKYSKKKIPRNLVIDFYETNGQCSQPAVVFITRKKLQMCTNPSEQWVEDYMKYLKMNRTVNATATY